MKKIIGWAIFVVAWMFIAYGVIEFGPLNVLVPGLGASLLGFGALGAIYLIRYSGKQEIGK